MGLSHALGNTTEKDGIGRRSRKLEAVSNVFFSSLVVMFFFPWSSRLSNVHLVNRE